MMTIREQLESRERDILAPQAAKSAGSRGRLRPEPEDDVRPAFQRDRDRIIHCKAFRRLKHKTQVFFAPTGAPDFPFECYAIPSRTSQLRYSPRPSFSSRSTMRRLCS